MSVSLVSCYYRFASKHTIEEYDRLLITLLSLPNEKDSVDNLSEAKMLLDKIKQNSSK